MIWDRITNSLPILWADFQQTFMKACSLATSSAADQGFWLHSLIDRSPFLQRGLLPLGNFVSALPIIGVAPIMVMWFGFDWQSKGRRCCHHDLLPNAGEHGAGPRCCRATCSAISCAPMPAVVADPDKAAPADCGAVHLQCA